MAENKLIGAKSTKPYEITDWPVILMACRNARDPQTHRPFYDFLQLHEIAEGLRHNVDVSVYGCPAFNNHQMYALRIGLQNGLYVGDVADPSIPWMDMLTVLEERGDGLAYDMDGDKEKRLEMPDVDAIERAILEDSVAKTAPEPQVGIEDIYDTLSPEMREYVDGLMKNVQNLDSDIAEAKTAVERSAGGVGVQVQEQEQGI